MRGKGGSGGLRTCRMEYPNTKKGCREMRRSYLKESKGQMTKVLERGWERGDELKKGMKRGKRRRRNEVSDSDE